MDQFPAPESPLQAVVFDLDGLMFNTEDLYQDVGGTILARRGCEFTPELLNEMMGRQSRKALQIMIDWHGLDDTVDNLTAESMEVMLGILDTRLQPMPGLLALLDALERHQVPKAIATSSHRDFLEHVLRVSGLADRFAFTLAAEDIENGKPDPDVYLLAAKQHAVLPEQVLVLEDSQIGCRAAVAANTYAVAVPAGHTHTHEFSGAKFVADTLADRRIYQVLRIPPTTDRQS